MHERGLIHRDVKPSNLSLTAGKRVIKVLDVGLVKDPAAAAADGLTRVGWLVGTVDYAAPEQVVDARTADHRADQYALGATLYHMLIGVLPFPSGTPAVQALRQRDRRPRTGGRTASRLARWIWWLSITRLAAAPGGPIPIGPSRRGGTGHVRHAAEDQCGRYRGEPRHFPGPPRGSGRDAVVNALWQKFRVPK